MKKRKSGKKSFVQTKMQATFLAFLLPEWLKNKILQIQSELDRKDLPVVWENESKLHVTLVYLGRITEDKFKVMRKVVKEELRGVEAFDVSVGYLDYKFQKHGEGLIWLRLADCPEMVAMHRWLVRKLNGQGFSLSDRKLVPHITIGRLKRMRSNDQKRVLQVLTEDAYEDLGTFRVDRLSVLFSRYRRDWRTTEYKEHEVIEFENIDVD